MAWSADRAGGDDLAIRCRNLHRWHGDKLAVDDLSLDIPRGARHAFIGANGAGKTTLMEMLATVRTPTSGRLHILGCDAVTDPRLIKRRIGVVPQGVTYDNELCVVENLSTFGRYHGLESRAASRRAYELLEMVDLADAARAMPADLSGGMQRRLLFARALVNEPELILLDEPTTGLDPEGRRILWDRLSELRNRDATLILTTHYLAEVDELCDMVTVMHDGRAVASATPQELVSKTVRPWVLDLHVSSVPRDLAPEFEPDSVTIGRQRLIFADDRETLAGLVDTDGGRGALSRIRPSTTEDALHTIQRDAKVASGGPRTHRPPPAIRQRRNRSAPSIRLAARVWHRNLTLFRRAYRTTIVPNFFEPVFSLLTLGLGLGHYVDQSLLGSYYPTFVAPGLLALTAANGATFEVTYNIFVRLRYARSYAAVVTTPAEAQDIGLGEYLWALTRCFVYSTIFLALLLVLGLAPARTAFLAPLGLLLLGAVSASIGMLYTSVVRAINSYSYFYTILLTPLAALSGIFFPVDRLPQPVRMLNFLNPLYHGVELSRSLITTGRLSDALAHAAWLAVVGALLLLPAVYSLRRHLTP